MATISISKKQVVEKDGMVVMPIREYNRLLMASVPTYQLKGKAAHDLDTEYETAWADYRAGKTIKAHSLTEALAKYRKTLKKRVR